MVLFTCLTVVLLSALVEGDDEWVHLPNKCEVCKFVSIEMKSAFDETGKTKEVIERNYRFLDDNKGAPPIKYVNSDIRFIEVVENVCQRLSGYNLHKEREGSNRFAKGMSETFSTLHGLVHKGVKVVMDIPYELWNETSAEVADLKKQCDVMIEQYEEVIEDWYKGSQEEDLTTYLSCLKEEYSKKKGDAAAIAEERKKKKKKKKKGTKSKDLGGGGGGGGSEGSRQEGEKTMKKKKKEKVNKKKKRKGKVLSAEKERVEGEEVSSDQDIQKKVALPGKNTEL